MLLMISSYLMDSLALYRVMRFRKKTETENRHEITEITDSFDQLNYFDKNKHVLCVILNIFILTAEY